ncbi:MAG: ribonuclease III [Ruminococcaceae bacterium]|nr:ribonuclease III [Oscillospiraceae bacterium]
MENYFALQFDEKQVNAVSNLGLAHIGDAVYELLCRSYLCCKGDKTVKNLHKDSVAMVKAPTQAKYADKILPYLTEQEKDWFRRGKNAHTHAAPKSATPQEYAKATGLETLFGALYLSGRTDRLNELFAIITKE